MSDLEAILRWYGVLLAATVAMAPWVRLLCSGLSDRGAAITRPLALLGVVFPLWFLGGFDVLPYSTAGLWVTLGLAATSGWAVVLRTRAVDRGWLASLVLCEVAAVAVFVGYVWLRGFTPDIDNTEKPMDIALLSASARADSIPPHDPWFAGETINYYYLGYLLHGSVSRMAGVPTALGFNLGLATTGSMAIVAAAGLGFDATRRWGTRRTALTAGVGAAILVVVAGNMYAPSRLLQDPRRTIAADWWDQEVGIGWRSSRIVCDGPRVLNVCDDGARGAVQTINEFPSFSLLLGDLHPHVMALPYTLVALVLALNLALLGTGPMRMRRRMILLGVSGAATGSLYALNSWDYPTLLLVVLAGAWVATRGSELRDRIVAVGTLLFASIAAWAPFYLDFSAPVGTATSDMPGFLRDVPIVSTVLGTLAAVRGERTSAGEFLTVFGLPYAAALGLILSGLGRSRDPMTAEPGSPGMHTATESLKGWWPVLAVVVVAGLIIPAPVVILCGIPLVLSLAQLGAGIVIAPRTIATALFALGFALLIGTEFFYIQDLFGDRMNTVFKVYYQVWTLFAVGAVLGVVAIVSESPATAWARTVAAGSVVVGLALGLAYPAVAYYQWTGHFRDWQGLDGLAYVRESNPGEIEAIRWLYAHAGQNDVVLEAAGCSYGNTYSDAVRHNRVSAFTGIPTVIGWGWHETQWRNGQPEVGEISRRQSDVRTMYQDPQSPLFDLYGVTYLYVGTLEREGSTTNCGTLDEPYPGVSDASYPGAGWQRVFAEEDVAIFRRDAADAAAVP